MKTKPYHIVYLIRNLVNYKIYVGVHSTQNLYDGYLGSGKMLKLDILKYGKENFERTILHYCYNEQQMYEVESKIVDKSFVSRKDTYNITIGGHGGDVYNCTRKTYEELHGIEKAKELKSLRSKFFKGSKRSKETCKILSEKRRQRITKDSTRLLMSTKRQGKNNNRAKTYVFISPINEIIFVKGTFRQFCKNMNTNYSTFHKFINTKLTLDTLCKCSFNKYPLTNYLDWECRTLEYHISVSS